MEFRKALICANDTCSSSKHEYLKTETKLANSSNHKKVDKTRRGSAGVVRSMMLLNSFEEMHAPYTQVSLYQN